MMLMKRIGLAIFLALAIGLIGVGVLRSNTQRTADAGKLTVIATAYPWYEFARQVGGDRVRIDNLTPAGAEPHDYEPSPRQLVAARKARVFIYSGAGLEPWTETFLPEYSHKAVKASEGMALLGEGASRDPHFWLDPVLAQQAVDTIRDALIQEAPRERSYFMRRAADYRAQLAQLDQSYISTLATCRLRTIITSHDAFSYLAKRYNLEVLSIAGLSPEEEPSPGKLAELSRLAKARGITHIFFESLAPSKLAETLAREAGVRTALFDTIEGISDEDQAKGKNYLSFQQANLASLRTALAC